MYGFMAWLQGSLLGHAMRESGVWTYGVVNLFHIVGVSSLFGAVLVLDLRLIGVWRGISLPAITIPTVPIAATGFCIAATSGICLFATRATEYAGNPFLYIKFSAIALGMINVLVLNLSSAWQAHRTRELSRREQSQLAAVGGISLFCWLTAITAGRMIGYWS